MGNIDLIYQSLQKKGYRITEQRKNIIDILYKHHLTLKELKINMANRGYTNTSTIFNNLKFLINNKLIMEIYIDNIKYYDLTIEDFTHSNNHIVHVLDEQTNTLSHVPNEKIISNIKNLLREHNLDVTSIHLTIKAKNINKKTN